MSNGDLLIDQFYKDTFHKIRDGAWWRMNIMQANRFVLNDDSSSFFADLGMEGFLKKGMILPNKIKANLNRAEHLRKLARLPHKIMWVELNNRVRLAREAECGASIDVRTKVNGVKVLDLDDVVQRCGYLMEQHPDNEAAFRATYVARNENEDEFARYGETYHVPFSFQWTTDDSPLAWPEEPLKPLDKIPAPEDFGTGDMMTVSSAIVGLAGYDNPCVGICSPTKTGHWGEGPTITMRGKTLYRSTSESPGFEQFIVSETLREFAGELRYIWAFLATVNDVSYDICPVRSQRQIRAGGTIRKGLDHSVVYLNIPNQKKSAAAYARSVMLNIRHKAHMCRGHWRHYKGGARTWIKEHKRGDESLGWVTTNYRVGHTEKDIE